MPATASFYARTDSGSANNPALNLTGDPAMQITFIAEDFVGNPGDLFLEKTMFGRDLDTVVSIGGTNYAFNLEFTGTLPTLAKDGAQQVPDQFEGDPVIVVTIIDYPGAGQSTRLAFLPQSNAPQAEMDAFGNGAIDVQNVNTAPGPVPVCFLEGTRIATPDGDRRIETLRHGDLVLTRDRGARPVRWIGRSEFRWPGAVEDARPILIRAGALGPGLPRADLAVSPQHRMLLSGPAVRRHFGVAEALAPAKALTELRGVRTMPGKRVARFYHLMLDRHEILTAEGAPSESFYPGSMALRALSARQRAEIHVAFPALQRPGAGAVSLPARRLLSRREARRLMRDITGRCIRRPAEPEAA